MIVDNLQNADIYYCLHPNLQKALEFLKNQDICSLPPGRYDVDGDNCFAVVSDYDTVPVEQKRWEAHRRYWDVQYVACGEELMGYSHIAELEVVEDYSEAKDILWLKGAGDFVTAKPGTFILLAPQDAHMPGAAKGRSEHVRKVVVKVLV